MVLILIALGIANYLVLPIASAAWTDLITHERFENASMDGWRWFLWTSAFGIAFALYGSCYLAAILFWGLFVFSYPIIAPLWFIAILLAQRS